jgi:hypothetical protein
MRCADEPRRTMASQAIVPGVTSAVIMACTPQSGRAGVEASRLKQRAAGADSAKALAPPSEISQSLRRVLPNISCRRRLLAAVSFAGRRQRR